VEELPLEDWMVISTEEFKGDKEGDLNFEKGEVITILNSSGDNGWFYGDLKGKRGWLPSNIVERVSVEYQKL